MLMKKNLIFRLFLLMVLFTLFHSCIHDEALASSDPASKEYTNKSLWKEDEKYIKNVRKVFDTYADKNYFSANSGEIYWDYALTMGTFDESFLEAPVIKNGKINYILVVYREGDKVYFKRKDERESIDFFNILVFKDRKQLKGRILEEGSQGNVQNKGVFCHTSEVVWTWTNDDGSPGETFTYHETSCKSTGPYLPCTSVDPSGDCPGGSGSGGSGGTGGGGGGYPYPQTPQTPNPCERMKTQTTNANYKAKVDLLASKTGLKKETGFAESKSGVFTELSPAVSTASSDGMTVTVTPDLKGYIHTHLNDYETGTTNDEGDPIINQPIRMFSPADVNTLMTMAQMATNGNYAGLYGTMVSSYGNYTIMFTGAPTDIKTGFDTEQWRKDYIAYREKHDRWTFEKLFLNFLKDKMNVQGIELYKIKSNGTIQKKTLNSNNNVQSNDCPQ